MFASLINFLKENLSRYNLECSKYSNEIYYFSSVEYNLAFDLIRHDNYVSVDLVLRPGFVRKGFLEKKYTEFLNNKKRLFTIEISCNPNIIFDFIKNEYLEIIYYYAKNLSKNLYSKNITGELILQKPLEFWFFDAVPNFGDFMTPWLANHFTNRPVLNVRNLPSSEGAILGVGSIVQGLDINHKKAKVWGSGIISANNHLAVANKLKKAQLDYVYACRGELTKKFFSNYNFELSGILGDPGLLFGNLYNPKKTNSYKYAIIPHYIHYQFFKDLNIENCVVVNVRDELTRVLDQIASAEKVISTSMHGLIIAQTYNIPWLHLYINDGRLLVGEEFKFEDFFSILERENVAQCKIKQSEIDKHFLEKLFNRVTLPKFKSNYSEQALIESFFESLDNSRSQKKNLTCEEEKLPKLIFLGDSHIAYFKSGAINGLYAPFNTDFCMASGATVSGLDNPNSFTKASEKFVEFISKQPKDSELIFQLGEIDCGILIWLKSKRSNISINEQLDLSLKSYSNFISNVKKLGYVNIVITSATLPTINDTDSIGEIISLRRQQVDASFFERTELTLKFNQKLLEMCNQIGVTFIDSTKNFINQETKLCDSKFRNKNKSDHHMDNLQASLIWSNMLIKYLFNKHNIKSNSVKYKCVSDSFIKMHKLSISKLTPTMYIPIESGDVVEGDLCTYDDNYISLRNIKINYQLISDDFKFLYMKHFIHM